MERQSNKIYFGFWSKNVIFYSEMIKNNKKTLKNEGFLIFLI